MTESAEGFVLREIRYGDNGSIVKIYTKDKGLRSFFVKGVRPSGASVGRSSRHRQGKAGLFPFLELEFTYVERRESQTLYTLRQFRPSGLAQRLYGDVTKVCMLTFLAEMLSKCLAEGQADDALYGYIAYFVQRLDAAEKPYGHYHVWFLLTLCRYLGCYPQVAEVLPDAPGLRFDLQDGVFCRMPVGTVAQNPLSGTEAAAALYRLLSEPDRAEESLRRMGNTERQSLLHLLVQYYTVQFSLPEIKSYAVLREVYNL
ncbi:MAG: recombination protein O N-terminal domain-containing protein [Bacteroidales bacterium]|nr:recombination protein O N-terminal domain-containing protein [Bacteroidales bacterium]